MRLATASPSGSRERPRLTADPERLRARRAAKRARTRRRRALAAGLIGTVAAGALVLILAGGGNEEPASPEPSPISSGSLEPRLLAGQRLLAGWDGRRPPRGLRRLIRGGGIAGVILFADNAPDRRSARISLRRLQRLPRPPGLELPLLVLVDQEGGRVRRLAGPPADSAERIGARGRGYAFAQGEATGTSLARVGVNVDLAPVLDVARPGSALDREQRSFGSTPDAVIETGVDGFAAGLAAAGVAATAKHFPGIGAIATNTDLAPQRVRLSAAELRAVDEPPFAAFVADGGELVMLALATYPALAERPAALSRRVVGGELRGRLGFEGVTITDALDAAAARSFGSTAAVALAAIRAGNDLLLYPDWREARVVGRLLRRRLRSGRLDREAMEEAGGRVLALRSRLAEPGR